MLTAAFRSPPVSIRAAGGGGRGEKGNSHCQLRALGGGKGRRRGGRRKGGEEGEEEWRDRRKEKMKKQRSEWKCEGDREVREDKG